MTGITLRGFILVPETDLAAVQGELANHITLTRAEPGCISFSVTQDPDNPLRYNVEEEFESRSAFETHQDRVSNSYWGEVTRDVERHYTIQQRQS